MSLSIHKIDINSGKLSEMVVQSLANKIDKTEPIKYYGLVNEYVGKYDDNPSQIGYCRVQIHAYNREHAVVILKNVEEKMEINLLENKIDQLIDVYSCDDLEFKDFSDFISTLSNDLVENVFDKDEIDIYLVEVQPFT